MHVICNNAGIGPLAPVKDLTLDDWRWMLGVNLWGVIHGVHTFLPILSANPDGGHIVNTASMAGLVAHARLGAYSTAKFGVVALTEALAEELAADGSRVGVSVLCPGTVHNNIGTSSRNRPAGLGDAGFKDIDIELEDNPRHRWIYPDQVGRVVGRAVKLRLGDTLNRDIERTVALRSELGPDVALLADANCRYLVDDVRAASSPQARLGTEPSALTDGRG